MSYLRPLSVVIGLVCTLVSVFGIGCVLYLLFGGETGAQKFTEGTYTPSWEDFGPALAAAVLSLVFAVLLMGGALQYSKNLLLCWIVWSMVLLVVFWLWYGYNQLKHYGYIDWSTSGCHFCGQADLESAVSLGGAIATFCLFMAMVPVAILHGKFKRRENEEDVGRQQFYDPYQQHYPYQYQQPQPQYYPQHQQQQQYHHRYQQQQPMMEYKF